MLERIDGDKQSPENSTNDFGFYYFSYCNFALKFTMPPKSPFACKS